VARKNERDLKMKTILFFLLKNFILEMAYDAIIDGAKAASKRLDPENKYSFDDTGIRQLEENKETVLGFIKGGKVL
jgi:hypothetical protein